MSNVPAWIQALQGLLTPVIAIAVGVIAFLQWRTAHQKLLYDLFSKRFGVYEQVRDTIDEIMEAKGNPFEGGDLLKKIHRVCQESRFLFGQEVVDQLLILEKKIVDVEVNSVISHADKVWGQIDAVDAVTNAIRISDSKRDALKMLSVISAAMGPYMQMDQRRIRTPAEWIAHRNRIRLSYADEKQR